MLHITNRFDNGYHHLQSVFAFTQKDSGLWDDITLSLSEHFSFTYTTEPYVVADKSFQNLNVIPQTWDWFCRKGYNVAPVHIHLHKRLPIGSGLGSGSSNMAAVLYGISSLNHFSEADMRKIEKDCGELGADAPLCFQHYRSPETWFWCDGSGQEGGKAIPRWSLANEMVVLITNPGVCISTPEVFKAYKMRDQPFHHPVSPPFKDKDWLYFLQNSMNDLAFSAEDLYPHLREIFLAIKETQNVLLARLSGSGPSIFVVYPDKESGEKALQTLKILSPNTWLTKI